jgi:hypothetical protein
MSHPPGHQRRLGTSGSINCRETSLNSTAAEKLAPITRMLREQRREFDPDDIAKLDIAYHAVLHQLRLADREDGATLIVAKRVIDLAIMGERDPERLVAASWRR